MKVPLPRVGSRRGFLVSAAALLLATATMTTPALAAEYTFYIQNNTKEPFRVTVGGKDVGKPLVYPTGLSESMKVKGNGGVSIGARSALTTRSVSKSVTSSGIYGISVDNGKFVLKKIRNLSW